MNAILSYLKQTYDPLSIILYGSYADGTANEHSDFDALVISKDHEQVHDVSTVNGTQLDVFVYPQSCFQQEFDCMDFVQIADGQVMFDTDGIADRLRSDVRSFLDLLPMRSPEEARESVAWCRKMLARTERADAEGFFRWHWVLCDSLEIFCDLMQHRYFGPKKTLLWMKNTDPQAYSLYFSALQTLDSESLRCWIDYLSSL